MAQPDRCPSTLQEVNVLITTATTTSIVATPGLEPANAIRVWRILISSATAQDLTLKSGSTVLNVWYGATYVQLDANRYEWFKCGTNEAFTLTTSGAFTVSVKCSYTNTPCLV